MKNLENFGVQELNAKEMAKINGGYAWYVVLSLSVMAYEAVKGAVQGFKSQLAKEASKLNV